MSIPTTQRVIVISKAGGPDVLVPAEVPVPSPGEGQVLIEVAAAGINRHDVHQRANGIHHDGSPTPGLEVCGRVVAVGAGVTAPAIGDRVMALVQGGGYGEYAVAAAALALPVPENVSDAEAACVPEALFTAWWNYFGLMDLQKDQFGLFHGGTSGVGHLALQALSALGYRVIATAGSERKVKAAKEFGAFEALNYNDAALAEKVLDATDGTGISCLIDVSAGAHLTQDVAMMAPDGTIAHLSAGGGAELSLPLRSIMAKRIRITGSFLRPLALELKTQVADRLRREVLPLIGNEVRPVIAQQFELMDAKGAHAGMEKASHIGKIVLVA
ncbi:alcohol dehydrogenase [Sulfitobacter alexandrii]|uniref:Alcohol dehydrogenase n=1 Tax=Sulfitobacter alexandrii TaxID=1917485 RepID=A0A1J0WDS2_9RHOB|nr:NAD(P)H-quinone oxidoreductase [Sulfitobacter alexandrii]APE42460.1 alcohol dehydrogenase [Sulfitobacter alexandrii]